MMMKKQFAQNASTTAKFFAVLCLALIVCYIAVIMNDMNHYHQQIGAVMTTAAPAAMLKMGNAFMAIAANRCPMILAPAAVCGGIAVIMQMVKKQADKASIEVQPVQA